MKNEGVKAIYGNTVTVKRPYPECKPIKDGLYSCNCGNELWRNGDWDNSDSYSGDPLNVIYWEEEIPLSSLLDEKEKEIDSLKKLVNYWLQKHDELKSQRFDPQEVLDSQLSQPPQQEKVKGIDWTEARKRFVADRNKPADYYSEDNVFDWLKQTYPTVIPSQQVSGVRTVIDSLNKQIIECNTYLTKRNDMGQTHRPDDKSETISYTRGKSVGLIIARDEINELLKGSTPSKEAVEFAEWINRNGYEPTALFPLKDNNKWSDDDAETTKTTSQLYELYTKQK